MVRSAVLLLLLGGAAYASSIDITRMAHSNQVCPSGGFVARCDKGTLIRCAPPGDEPLYACSPAGDPARGVSPTVIVKKEVIRVPVAVPVAVPERRVVHWAPTKSILDLLFHLHR